MKIESAGYKELLNKRPLNVQAIYGNEPVALVSGRDIADAAKQKGAIVLAANVRNPLTIKGVLKAAKKKRAAVLLELAKSEATYCGCTFDNVPDFAVRYSAELGHGVVFGLHVDHYGIKSKGDLLEAVTNLCSIVSKGWTSVAIDASHNPDWENFCYTRDIAMSVPAYLGLEVEVGEIKGPGELTTVEEALFFIGGLNAWGIFPDYLAISNGSKHGTYDTSKGEKEGIDLERTKEVADAISKFGVSIAQHGISGTPLDKVSLFPKFGINKGNVGTLWQNIVFGLMMDPETGNAITENGEFVKDPKRGIPQDLWMEIVKWADSQGFSRKDGNYKKANKPFHDAIMSLPEQIKEAIVEETAEWAERFIDCFNCEGTADLVMELVSKRESHNCAPCREILTKRSDYTQAKVPNRKKLNQGKDYSD
ncbi:class II fructose-bisphosphate aldolase [Thermovirga sp.]|uniref:class II fructose-bisphosphate aldolase n=1 Tax=Thermovirga sp. TaxID=2699834 RepID=UPI0025EA409F|nr:class II fructose-bisphosphate aldolase [Thermovirga sp.]MBO8153481.1 class II fructose-bisphosphate aldolase [Thermovirga sp.]